MGLGYIGLPTAIIAAKHGIEIIGVDINPKVVEMTNQGKLHIIEPGMPELLQEVVSNGQLKASTKPENSKQNPLSIDDVAAMVAGQIGQLTPMDEETAEIGRAHV